MEIPRHFEFFCPIRIFSGSRALEHLPGELRALNASRPLVLATQGTADRGLTRILVKAFADSGMPLGLHEAAPESPDAAWTARVKHLFVEHRHDALLVMGDGPLVTAAKILNIAVSIGPEDDLAAASGDNRLTRPLLPFVVIPTGVDCEAVASPTAALGPWTFRSPALMAALVALDPRTIRPGDAGRDAAVLSVARAHAARVIAAAPRNPVGEAYARAGLALLDRNGSKAGKGERWALANGVLLAGCAHAQAEPAGPDAAEAAFTGEPATAEAASAYLPDYYEFLNGGRIVAGHDALKRIPTILADLGAKNPLIVTDRGVAGAGLVEVARNALRDALALETIADDVPVDSDIKAVRRIAELYRQRHCDSFIAVGGGSVMDTAKGVNIVVSENARDLMAYSGVGAIRSRLRPLIAVPTTSGTGSEVTQAAVIKDHEKHYKTAFMSPFLLPDAAVLDPRMTLTLPPAVTAQTAMDALTHAMEAYTCLAKNPLSDAFARAAVALIGRHLLPVMKNPADGTGRLALAIASNLAGVAFSNSMVGMVHCLGHATGSACGVPHGICMAILLPYGLEYNLHKTGRWTAELLLPLAGRAVCDATPPEARAAKVIALVRQLNQDLHDASQGQHPRTLKEVVDRGLNRMIPRERLPEIVAAARCDGAIFYNPEEMDADDFRMVLEAAWEGVALDLSRIRKG
ncbi:MAG TPA: iron-containing alcohol dehydrogenase [Syntrophales bacterium]|nr:iron-containing alcohol dehydrogenase [Syntrophales bacterium]